MRFFSSPQNTELLKEKLKDYRNVVILQVFIIFISLVLKDVLEHAGLSASLALRITKFIFLVSGGVYLFLLWDMLRNFTSSKVIIKGTLYLLLFAYIFGSIFTNPFYEFWHFQDLYRQEFLLAVHVAMFIVEVIIIYYNSYNLFSRPEPIENKLWGAACVYVMIGISFGSMYDIICIIDPDGLGVKLDIGLISYMEGIYYSMNTLGGLDTAYPNAIKLIRNLGVMESVWSNLFIVILVGRILIRYRKPEEGTTHNPAPIPEDSEEQNPFKIVLWTQIILIAGGMTLVYFFDILNMHFMTPVLKGIFLIMGAIYLYTLKVLLQRLKAPEKLTKITFYLLIAAYVAALVAIFPYFSLLTSTSETIILAFVHVALLIIQIIVISYTIPNVFSGRKVNQTKIFGTASVYLMMGFAFASVYELMNILIPGCFGTLLEAGFHSYSESIYYSMHTLAGLDTDYPEAYRILRNTGVIEAVWGELFIALLVGNLLNKPEQEE